MGYFQVRYDYRVVNYNRRGFIRLATGEPVGSESGSIIQYYLIVRCSFWDWVYFGNKLPMTKKALPWHRRRHTKRSKSLDRTERQIDLVQNDLITDLYNLNLDVCFFQVKLGHSFKGQLGIRL